MIKFPQSKTYLSFTVKIMITNANFRSMIMDVMNLVKDLGPVDMSEITIPRNMNETNV